MSAATITTRYINGATNLMDTHTVNILGACAATFAISPTNPSLPRIPAGSAEVQLSVAGTASDMTPIAAVPGTWSSATANVNPTTGYVSSSNAGSHTVTFTPSTPCTVGATATTTVSVVDAAILGITITPSPLGLALGQTVQLTANASFQGFPGTVDITSVASWSPSGAANPASVSDTTGTKGGVTGNSLGTTVITASYGTQSAQVTATVTAAQLTDIVVTFDDVGYLNTFCNARIGANTFPSGVRIPLILTGIFTDTDPMTGTFRRAALTTANAMISTTASATFPVATEPVAFTGGAGTAIISARVGTITSTPANSLTINVDATAPVA